MSERDFQAGWQRALIADAERALAIYSSPEARAKPVSAWALLPCCYSPETTLRYLAEMDEDPSPDAVAAYADNLDFLTRRLAMMRAQFKHWSTPNDQHVPH